MNNWTFYSIAPNLFIYSPSEANIHRHCYRVQCLRTTLGNFQVGENWHLDICWLLILFTPVVVPMTSDHQCTRCLAFVSSVNISGCPAVGEPKGDSIRGKGKPRNQKKKLNWLDLLLNQGFTISRGNMSRFMDMEREVLQNKV